MGLAIASITNSPLVYAISAINSTAITTTALLDNIETKKVRVGSAGMTLSTFLSNYQTPIKNCLYRTIVMGVFFNKYQVNKEL